MLSGGISRACVNLQAGYDVGDRPAEGNANLVKIRGEKEW